MKRISRRNFLKAAGVGAAALGLAACGSSSSSTGSSTTSSAAASATPAEDVTIKVAAIETAYGSEMWQKVTEAFTAQTGMTVKELAEKGQECTLEEVLRDIEERDRTTASARSRRASPPRTRSCSTIPSLISTAPSKRR